MKFATVRTIVMMAGAGWCSFSFLKSATKRGTSLRWYDRTIHFLGAILMAAIIIGGFLLISGKLISK